MGVPEGWSRSAEHQVCKRCGGENFSDIGECMTEGCDGFLVVHRVPAPEQKTPDTPDQEKPKKPEKVVRRHILAAEKWAQSRIPKNASRRCYMCGCRPAMLEEEVQSKTVSIMVALLVQGKPEYKQAQELMEKLDPERKKKDQEYLAIAKALSRGENMALSLGKESSQYKEVVGILGEEGKYSICLNCACGEKTKETSAALKINVESEEMPPKLKQTEQTREDWGEETIEHEEWSDDPSAKEVEKKAAEEDWDDWDDGEDWEELAKSEKAAKAAPVPEPYIPEVPAGPAPVVMPEMQEVVHEDEGWDDEWDDDWDENEVEVIR